jgi:hypothetical protein
MANLTSEPMTRGEFLKSSPPEGWYRIFHMKGGKARYTHVGIGLEKPTSPNEQTTFEYFCLGHLTPNRPSYATCSGRCPSDDAPRHVIVVNYVFGD